MGITFIKVLKYIQIFFGILEVHKITESGENKNDMSKGPGPNKIVRSTDFFRCIFTFKISYYMSSFHLGQFFPFYYIPHEILIQFSHWSENPFYSAVRWELVKTMGTLQLSFFLRYSPHFMLEKDSVQSLE